MEDLDTPIALRRTPRRSTSGMSATIVTSSTAAPVRSIVSANTPSRTRTKKRVRFSDPGPEISHSSPCSTGLTPMVRRSNLGTAPSSKRRRFSTPASLGSGDDVDELSGTGESQNEVYFLPLRQVLDSRVKRRIRRNGLSEEMNVIDDEKRCRTQKQKEEIERLRRQLDEKDQEIERLRDTTVVQDTERIIELEGEVERLREELNEQPEAADQSRFDWTTAARDPFSDSCMDDDGFGDTTMGGLMCSTPTRARASFLTPPCTSPTAPVTPLSKRGYASSPVSHTGVQAQLPDPEKEALEAELGSLRLELTKLNDTLDSHQDRTMRIADRLSDVEPIASPNKKDVEENLEVVLQSLSDKTAVLVELNSSLTSLGFRGQDASDVVSSISGALRSARLELEYLTPGEITLPLSSHGAEVLDLVLTRLRDLSRRVKEDEASIDEYHSLELSLRQQLGARVEAMDGMSRELRDHSARFKEKDERIADLEIGTDRLKGAVEGYRRDIAELETLVQRLEDEGRESQARLQTQVDSGKQEIERRDNSIAELESRVAAIMSQAAEIKIQLASVQARRVANITALNKAHGVALALRDARVGELRGEIDSINASLRSAHATICQLRVENLGLKSDINDERRKAKDAVDSMKAELERGLAMSEGILTTPGKNETSGRRRTRSLTAPETPGKSSPQTVTAALGMLADSGRGKKRRRYDSGLGFLDEEEVDG